MISSKLRHFVNLINLSSCLFLIFALILQNRKLELGTYYVFFFSYVIEFFTDKKWQNFTFDRKTKYFGVILLFFALAFIYYPFEFNTHYFSLLIEKRYPLLGFSIVGIFGLNHFYRLRYFIISITFTSLAIILYLVFIKVGIAEFIKDENLFNLSRIKFVNTHMIMNFYINSSIIGIWYLLSRYWTKINLFSKIILFVSLFIFLYILSISEGRTGFVFGMAISFILVLYELWKKKKALALLFAFLIPWIALAMISLHQRMDIELIKNEPRYFLWEAGMSVVKEKPILGHGISSAQIKYDAAREIYQTEAYKNQWVASKHLDSHSQYIQSWMEFGVLGLILVLFIYLIPFFLVDKKRKIMMLLFIALCAFQSLFDMFLTGNFSAIFCLWLVFLLLTGDSHKKINKKNRISRTLKSPFSY